MNFFQYLDNDSGLEVKKMITEKNLQVEAAQIIAYWASKEEYHKVIFNDIGVSTILDLIAKPNPIVLPFIAKAFNSLLRNDSIKYLTILQGGIPGLITLLSIDDLIKYPYITRFITRTFLSISEVLCELIFLFFLYFNQFFVQLKDFCLFLWYY